MFNQTGEKCYLSFGIWSGIAIGAALGIIFDSIGVGICIGLGLMFGASIGGLINGCQENVKKVWARVFSVGVILLSAMTLVLLFPKITNFFD